MRRPDSEPNAGYPAEMDLSTPLRWLGKRDNRKKAADQDNSLIDTPEHSDVAVPASSAEAVNRDLSGAAPAPLAARAGTSSVAG